MRSILYWIILLPCCCFAQNKIIEGEVELTTELQYNTNNSKVNWANLAGFYSKIIC